MIDTNLQYKDGIQIVQDVPPIFDHIKASGLRPSQYAIYAFDGKIYNPSGGEIPDFLMVHEKTHIDQQGNDSYAWWERYLEDEFFRIPQEVEAYGNQHKFLCERYKDRNKQHSLLMTSASILAGEMYGNVVTTMGAYKMIKTFAKNGR